VTKRRHSKAQLALLDHLADAALRVVAGDKGFDRGVGYFAEQRVSFVAEVDGGAAFDVVGEQHYRTTLFADEVGLDAECTCPSDAVFCKHAVAAALYWRTQLGGAVPAPPPPRSAKSEKAAATRLAKRERVRAFLASQSVADLAERLWRAAERDASLMAELRTWEASARASDDPEALRQAVVEIVSDSRSRFLYGREVSAWAERAGTAEPLLRRALERSAEATRHAAEHALRRVYRAAEHMDDSDGEVGGVMDLLVDVLRDAIAKAPPPAAWAPHLLSLLEDDPYGIIDAGALLDAAGADFTRAFDKLVASRWDKHRSKSGAEERDHTRRFLRDLRLAALRRDGDTAALYDFMKRTAHGLFETMELVRWCDQHGRHRDALQLAQAACREFRNHRVVEDLLLQLYERDGWDEEAFAIRKRRFADTPDVRDYEELLAAATRVGEDVSTIRAWAYDMAKKQESQAPRGKSGRNVMRTVELMLHDDRLDAALALVRPPNFCDTFLLMRIAERLPAERNADAFELLDRALHAEMSHAQSPYREPLHIAALACARLTPAEKTAYLAKLQAHYKAKRNFVSTLPSLD
jgi:uncharacterized Zn finger protein